MYNDFSLINGIHPTVLTVGILPGSGKPLDYTLDKQVNLRLVFKSDKDRIKELEEENKKLRDALKILNEKLDVVNRRVNRMQDDAYNDIMPDRDDYR